MKRTKMFLVLLILLSFMLIQGCSAPESTVEEEIIEEDEYIELVMSTGFTATELATQANERMVEQVFEKTNGSLKINLFPASQLGAPIDEIEGVSMGSIDMVCGAAGFLMQFEPDMRVTGMFFVFDDSEHLKKYLESDINKGFEQSILDNHNIRVLSHNWLRVPRSFASTTLLTKVEDFDGQKIRSPEIDTYIESFKALGGSPTIVPWGETYLALSQGVAGIVDGPLDMLYHNNLFEVCKYGLLTEHLREYNYVGINNDVFNRLSKNQQDALIEAANEAGDWFTQTLLDQLDQVKEDAMALGVTFTEVDDIAPFAAKMTEAVEVLEAQGLWRPGLYDEVRALR